MTPGDANGDGTVDINDLTIVLANYGRDRHGVEPGRIYRRRHGGHQRPDHRAGELRHDLRVGGRLAAVPEPSALLLIGLAVVSLVACTWRRRR